MNDTSGPQITAPDCERLAALVYARLGINPDPERDDFLRLRLRDRMLALGLHDPAEYFRHLTVAPDGGEELTRLLDSILVNETYFFRTQPQLDALRQVIVPELLRRKQADAGAEYRFWSAGCATGEEVYTLALILRELLPPDARRLVLGTDISQRALAAAAAGVYGERSMKNVTPAQRQRFFTETPQGWQVGADLRADCLLRQLNLMQPVYPEGFDAIFCRNVLIYFDQHERACILRRLYESLNPDGYLVVGYSENLRALPEYYRSCAVPGAVIYRKWSIDRRRRSRVWNVAERRRRAVTRFTVGECRRAGAAGWTVAISGLIVPGPDSRELAELKEQVLTAVPLARLRGMQVLLNLHEVSYFNNHALGALKEVRETARKAGVTVQIAANEYAAEAILASDLYEILAPLPVADAGTADEHSVWRSVQRAAARIPLQRKPAAPPAPRTEADAPAPEASEAGTAVWDAAGRCLTLRGEWPQTAAAAFRQRLLRLLEDAGRPLTIDMSAVAFMDVALLQELARFCRHYRGDGGTLVVAGANATVQRRLCRLLDLTPDDQLALFAGTGRAGEHEEH